MFTKGFSILPGSVRRPTVIKTAFYYFLRSYTKLACSKRYDLKSKLSSFNIESTTYFLFKIQRSNALVAFSKLFVLNLFLWTRIRVYFNIQIFLLYFFNFSKAKFFNEFNQNIECIGAMQG